jgi:hypothetical protein
LTCPDCGKKQRAKVNVPDVRSRVAAIELLLREGLGRRAQAEEPHQAALPATAAAVQQMSWSGLQTVFALEFATASRWCARRRRRGWRSMQWSAVDPDRVARG